LVISTAISEKLVDQDKYRQRALVKVVGETATISATSASEHVLISGLSSVIAHTLVGVSLAGYGHLADVLDRRSHAPRVPNFAHI
jgi:hypothetical protein